MIAIVGGGLTGLFLAEELARAGKEFLVLEGEDRPGGVVRSERVGGRLLEFGPQRGRLTPELGELVRSLGLEEELRLAPPGLPLLVYRGGALREAPLTATALWRTTLLSPAGKLRLLAEPLAAWAEGSVAGDRPGESAADFLRRRFGEEAYAAFLGPLFGGLYASDPARMPSRFALAGFLGGRGRGSLLRSALRRRAEGAGAPAFSFGEGLQRLPEALADRHRARARLGATVRALERSSGGFLVEVGSGSRPGGEGEPDAEREALEAESVVLTVPAPTAARLLPAVAPDAAERLARLRYNELVVVHLVSPARLHGYGYQVAFGEPLATRGVTWNASLFGRDGVYTAFLGGAGCEEVLRGDDRELAVLAAREFREVTGRPASPIRSSRVRVPAWDESWSALDGLELPDGVYLCANYESRIGISGRLAAARRLAARLAGG